MGNEKPVVVFDTGVFIQAALNPSGPAGMTVSFLDAKAIKLFVSEEGLSELYDVLHRPSVRAKNKLLTDQQIDALLLRLRTQATVLSNVPKRFRYERDPDDEPYINLVIEVAAAYLVSRDNDLLDLMRWDTEEGRDFQKRFRHLKILDPVAFLEEMRKN